jgi:Domain of unknown function (DUF4926)
MSQQQLLSAGDMLIAQQHLEQLHFNGKQLRRSLASRVSGWTGRPGGVLRRQVRSTSTVYRQEEAPMIDATDTVVLITELPEHGLEAGDVGTVVLVHRHGGYEVKFTTLDGETMAVVSLSPDQVRPAGRQEIAHARMIK